MGCGASAHVQGSSPLGAGAEQSSGTQEAGNANPAPVAEELAQEKSTQEVGKHGTSAAGQPAPPADLTSGDSQAQIRAPASPEKLAENGAPIPLFTPAPSSPLREKGLDDQQLQARLVLGTSTSNLDGLPRTAVSLPGQSINCVLDPAVTPNSDTATVSLLPGTSRFVPRSRYTNESDLSIASTSYDLSGRGDDSDDDELAALFTMQAWKRYYNYNKKKPQDLLTYFWRKFPPQDFSCFCISYSDQDLLLTPYMAENCVHGYCARLEDMGLADSLFLQMYVLHDFECDLYRIVGLLLVQGHTIPPPLSALSAFDGFVYQKADTSATLVKQFVSALLVGRSPLNSLQLLNGREVT